LLSHVLALREHTRHRGSVTFTGILSAIAGYPHGCTAYAEAEPLFREAIEIGEKTLGRQHPTVILFIRNFMGFLTQTGRDAEATALRARYGVPENGPE
jgi:hypothetical protein